MLNGDPQWPEVILERLCGPDVIAVEGNVLPAERRDMGKQIIIDNLNPWERSSVTARLR